MFSKLLSQTFQNQGEVSINLEKKIAELLGVKHVTVTTSGTVAIYMALKGYGIGHGDEVIVPDITYIATANAVDLAGAKPVFVDIDPETLNISVEAIEKAINKKTKAIVPVHVSGRGADMEAIVALAKKHNLKVVEDAAEAFMSKSKGKYLGTYGDAGCFSLSPNKTITSGQGGFVVTNDSTLHKRLWELKNQGLAGRLSGGDDTHPTVGYNFKFTDIQAALAMAQMVYLDTRLERMKRTHEIYKRELKNIKGLKVFECDTEAGEIPQWTDALIDERDELDAYLRTRT
jgi:perosamine synthetase